MQMRTTVIGGGIEILASKDYQAIPIKVATPGEGTVVKAGSPLTYQGAVTTAANATGILLYDVDTAVNPNGALVVQGIIDSKKAQDHSGVEYDSALMTALNAAGCSIIMRDNIRAPYEDATLSALTVGAETLTPTFSKNTYTYAVATTAASSAVTVTTTDANATAVIKNGSTTISSGSNASWEAGPNTLTVTVTAEDGTTTATYTVTVTKS